MPLPAEPMSQLSTSARFFSRAFGLSAEKKAAITASPIDADVTSVALRRAGAVASWIGARGVVGRGLDFRAALHRLVDALLHQLPEQRQAGLRRVPMRRRDLRRVSPTRLSPRLQRVVEEGELVLARQRREPQRQAGEIGRQRVLVDAVEAALRDQAAGVQLLVLVRRDGRLRVRVRAQACDQPRRRAAGRPRPGRRRSPGRIADLERPALPPASRPAPMRSKAGSSAWRTIGSVSERGV